MARARVCTWGKGSARVEAGDGPLLNLKGLFLPSAIALILVALKTSDEICLPAFIRGPVCPVIARPYRVPAAREKNLTNPLSVLFEDPRPTLGHPFQELNLSRCRYPRPMRTGQSWLAARGFFSNGLDGLACMCYCPKTRH